MYSTSHHHLFALPPDLLDTLTPRNVVGEAPAKIDAPEQTAQTSTPSVNGARSCNICLGASFVDVDEQRSHFRSDWHRYNVKTRLNSGRPVTELDFDHLVQGTSHPICRINQIVNNTICQHWKIRSLALHLHRMKVHQKTQTRLLNS